MALVNGYVSLPLFQAYSGIKSEDSADDLVIEDVIESASRIIDKYCRRQFYATTATTRYYDAVGPHIVGRTLRLDEDLLSIDTGGLTNGDEVAISTDDYVLLPYNETAKWGVRLNSNAGVVWTYSGAAEKCISVKGSWGFCASDEVPHDIRHACTRLAAMLYRQKATTAPIDRIEISPEGVPLIPGGLPRDIREILKPYRRMI